MRESAERAVAHVRPPGPIKHGGAAPWKQQLRPLSSASKYHTFAQPGNSPIDFTYTQKPADLSKDPINNLFRAIHDHAIGPVFKGLKTRVNLSPHIDPSLNGRLILRDAKTSFGRPPQSNFFWLPRRRTPGQVGLRLSEHSKWHDQAAQRATQQLYEAFINAPSLGLRAAVDELEDALRNGERLTEKRHFNLARSCKSSCKCPAAYNAKPIRIIERAPQSEVDAFWDDADSLDYSLDDDYCDTCSSAYVDGVVSSPETRFSDDDETFTDDCTVARPERAEVTTTMHLPMSPDWFRLIVGNAAMQEAEEHDELDYLHQIRNIVDEHDAFRLNVLVPLERGLQDGFLSHLNPHGWNAGQLYWGPAVDGHPYLTVTFFNSTRTEVLDMLQYDVGPRLYHILAPLITDDAGTIHDVDEVTIASEESNLEGPSAGPSSSSLTSDVTEHGIMAAVRAGAQAADGIEGQVQEQEQNDDGAAFFLTVEDLIPSDDEEEVDEDDEDTGFVTPTESSPSPADSAAHFDRRHRPASASGSGELSSPLETSTQSSSPSLVSSSTELVMPIPSFSTMPYHDAVLHPM